MATTFSLHNPAPGLHWFVSKPFGPDQIAAIRDPQGGQTDKQPTSIPSPFARLDLVRSAFGTLAQKPDLSGTLNEQRVVSDALDVGELFFNFDKLKSYVRITAWDTKTDLARLTSAADNGHRRLGDALALFLREDAQQFNFDQINRLFILHYGNRVVGGTSPKTLFFSSGNDLATISPPIQMGDHRLFDPRDPRPLHRRSIEYQTFWQTLRLVMPNFRQRFREVDDYLNHSRELFRQHNPALFYQHFETQSGQSLLSVETYTNLFDELAIGSSDVVEVLNFYLRQKKSDVQALETISDFVIKSGKYTGKPKPMVLPLKKTFYRPFTYVPQTTWNPDTDVQPFVAESWRDNQRALPGQPGNYPYLTVSDFLEPYLIRLPYPTDRARFFDGNLQVPASEKGYLLPLKKDFFEFFDADDLISERVRLRMEVRAGGAVKVTLDVPVVGRSQPGNSFITFERLYTPAASNVTAPVPNEAANEGVVLEDSFTVNVYPFVRSGAVTIPADYRVQLIESGYQKRSDYTLTYMTEKGNVEVAPASKHVRTSRQQNTDGSSQYDVLRTEFDYLQVSIRTDGHELRGLLLPRWNRYNGGNKQFAFAVDFGTTNTHIEFSENGQTPKPFEITEQARQIATLVNPAQYNPALFELFLLFDLEFVPPTIGPGSRDNFPTRTALAEPKNLNFLLTTETLADFNIPFYVERQPAGLNEINTDLKWATSNRDNDRRVRAFLEELLLLIKNKVLTDGGDLAQTTVIWFYPASMTPGRVSQLRTTWKSLYERYIGQQTSRLREVSESVAPFYYYSQNPMLSASARPVVNIDIGGGTSDVVVYQGDQPRLLTSFRFAGNAIYGDGMSNSMGRADHNGFVQRHKDRIQNLLTGQRLNNLSDKNKQLLDKKRSEEILAFWFSIERSDEVKDKSMLSFNQMLGQDEALKIVPLLFYSALIYHVAKLMKANGLPTPGALTFSGTGSKVLSIISPDEVMLERLAHTVFDQVYAQPAPETGSDAQPVSAALTSIFSGASSGSTSSTGSSQPLTFYSEQRGPKEVTCKGALAGNLPNIRTDEITKVYPATFNDEFTNLTYADLNRPAVITSLLKETQTFLEFFFTLNDKFSFSRNLNVSPKAVDMAKQELPSHLDTFLMSAIQSKQREAASESNSAGMVEETLFFYPLVGAMNKLAFAIYKQFGPIDQPGR